MAGFMDEGAPDREGGPPVPTIEYAPPMLPITILIGSIDVPSQWRQWSDLLYVSEYG
jgi:hypothetical protein